MLSAILWGGLAAASLLVGFYLAARGLSNRTIGMIMGIGAGALLSAIAYELMPESALDGGGMALAFCLGHSPSLERIGGSTTGAVRIARISPAIRLAARARPFSSARCWTTYPSRSSLA